MIYNDNFRKWIEHRAGKDILPDKGSKYQTKAIELNKQSPDFLKSFGNKEIKALIGFIDLVGFSERVQGKSTKEIEEYLVPFMEKYVTLLYDKDCLIDKTIGDELMFILPDMSEEANFPYVILLGQLLGGIHQAQIELGSGYPLKFGLAYGAMRLTQFRGAGYSEWTVVGETIHLAKRLMGISDIDTSNGVGGAFGMLKTEGSAKQEFDLLLEHIAGFASRMKHTRIESPPVLKGVSPFYCALLYSPVEKDGIL